MILRKNQYKKMMLLIFGISIFISINVNALCKYEIAVESKVSISLVKQYIYANNTNGIFKNDNIQLINTYYEDYYDAKDVFRKDYFLVYGINHNIIKEQGIAFYNSDDKIYHLIGGDGGISFEKNMANLKSAFPSEHINLDNDFNYCVNLLCFTVTKKGEVSIEDYYGGWECKVSESGEAKCQETHSIGG